MAINRFFQSSPTEAEGQFFKLPYQELATSIMAMDTAYAAKQKEIDDIFAAYQALEYLPGDQELATKRMQDLYEQERRVRNQVGDDILNPVYADNMRSLLRKEATDPFYKKAAWNLKIRNEYMPHRAKYMEKWGSAPEAWQDPTGQALYNYKNAEETGALQFNPIEVVLPFEPRAEALIKPMLDDVFKNPDGAVKVKRVKGPDGKDEFYFVNTKTNKLGADVIRDVIEGSELIGGPEYRQLQKRFENSPDLIAAYGTFDSYFNGILENLGKRLAVDYYQETFAGQMRDYEGKAAKTTKSDLFDFKVNRGAYQDTSGAQNPIGTPNKEMHNMRKTYYSQKQDHLWEDIDKKVYEMAGLDMPTTDEDGNPIPNQNGTSFQVAKNPKTGGMSVKFTFTNPQGKKETIDLLGSVHNGDKIRHLLGRKYEDFMTQLSDYNVEVNNAHSNLVIAEQMENRALSNAFGDYDASKQSRYEFLRDYYRKKYGEEDYERYVNTGAMKQFIAGIGTVGLGAVTQLLGDNFGGLHWQDVQRVLGIGEEAFTIPGTSQKSMEAFARNLQEGKVELPPWVADNGQITDEAMERILLSRLEKKDDENLEAYDKYFDKAWRLGLSLEDESLVPAGDERLAAKSGIRVAKKRIFYINPSNTSGTGGGKMWAEGYNKLVQGIEDQVKKSGGFLGIGGLARTEGAVPLYEWNTNMKVGEGERAKLGEIEVLGFSFDDGMTAVIKEVGGDKLYEFRDQDTLIEYLADSEFAPEMLLELTVQATKSFYGNEPNFGDDVLKTGQSRQSNTGKVGVGMYQAPIHKYAIDTIDPETGETIKAGHVRYFNQREQK